MKIFQKASHALVWLVFSFLPAGCRDNKKVDQGMITKEYKTVITEDGLGPRAIIIPRELLNDLSDESIRESLKVYLKANTTPVLGELIITRREAIFDPLVRFTRGLSYEVRLKDEGIATVTVPMSGIALPTALQNIYPSGDTVPENLLKIYLEFTQPMQEGHALENISVIKNDEDTIKDVFLDLQNELWNKEGTVLTLWLDPGRIKRDLQPNQEIGPPLEQGSRYKILIWPGWRDIKGSNLPGIGPMQKEFVIGPRDNAIPNYRAWDIRSPKAGSSDPLLIDLNEPLDYMLLKNAVHITDSKGNLIPGTLAVKGKERLLVFAPSAPWKAGDYVVEVESRLEDLAGNNLNRLFDRDITKKNTGDSLEVYGRPIIIQ